MSGKSQGKVREFQKPLAVATMPGLTSQIWVAGTAQSVNNLGLKELTVYGILRRDMHVKTKMMTLPKHFACIFNFFKITRSMQNKGWDYSRI